jgi:hypothetical protein
MAAEADLWGGSEGGYVGMIDLDGESEAEEKASARFARNDSSGWADQPELLLSFLKIRKELLAGPAGVAARFAEVVFEVA